MKADKIMQMQKDVESQKFSRAPYGTVPLRLSCIATC